ncbi:protein NLRC3 [Stegastes partitus]|uniref:Protein NLRC3-like n=1 Tax=Stegastes partitus TaxID=144197 RepID=A0A3B5BAL0_9TELE|nr:PREDICTED: protein NLRC3-like [Stegastes partitus]
MDSDSEVERLFTNEDEVEDEDEERKKFKRPPSSYGSMKSDSESMEDEEEEEEDEEKKGEEEEETDDVVVELPEPPAHDETGVQMNRPDSPETLYTMTTQQTKPPGAVVIDTRSSDLGDFSEDNDDEEDDDEVLITNSPEPPEPIEPDDTIETDDSSQPGRLHPEQDMPHVFRSMQSILTGLSKEDLLTFKMTFHQWEKRMTISDTMTGDILDFVDKSLEILGQERALTHTINTLETTGKTEEAEKLKKQCQRVLLRHILRQQLSRKHHVIHEGIAQAGKQHLLETVYVEPLIAMCSNGGVDQSHEFRPPPSMPLQVPSTVTHVGVNDLFRQQKDDGTPVRRVLTTGIPGIGMSVCVAKFSLDWAEHRANMDIQFVIKLSFQAMWNLRNRDNPPCKKMSIMEAIGFYYPDLRGMPFLDEDSCKYLVIMDSFDRYRAPLDWENAPVINDNHTQAHPDVLIVNIFRGTVLRGARVWILGRPAAVSQIPSQFIDLYTEIQGYSEELKDQFMTKRFVSAELAAKIMAHYKRLPTLKILTRQPFFCWMAAKVFERRFRYQGYGTEPPRLTPFYVNIFVIQMNRRLESYHEKIQIHLKWPAEDKDMLTNMGKMAFVMLEKNTSVFYEEDLKEHGLSLYDVVVCTGFCTELRTTAADGKRTFCFFHFTFQEFMAALYVFKMFHMESKNILDTGSRMSKIFSSKWSSKSAAGLVHNAIVRTFNAPLGHYDMFLRFLCGLLNPDCHEELLGGVLWPVRTPKVAGLDEVQRLLEQTIQKAPADRVENLKECLREMIQEDQ